MPIEYLLANTCQNIRHNFTVVLAISIGRYDNIALVDGSSSRAACGFATTLTIIDCVYKTYVNRKVLRVVAHLIREVNTFLMY